MVSSSRIPAIVLGTMTVLLGARASFGDAPAPEPPFDANKLAAIVKQIEEIQQACLKDPTSGEAKEQRGRIAALIPKDSLSGMRGLLTELRKLRNPHAKHGDGLEMAQWFLGRLFLKKGRLDEAIEISEEHVRC